MIYHPNESGFSKFVKITAFWISMLGMMWLFVLMFHDNIKIPQQQITLKIDVSQNINICLPEDEEIFGGSFFDF
jgi:hypothetical protein